MKTEKILSIAKAEVENKPTIKRKILMQINLLNYNI
jgi:hypothetical protein